MDARVATVAAALAELYRVRGFAAVRVSPRVTTGAIGRGAASRSRVRLEVAEGPHTSVTEVSFEGATALTPAELLESVALVTGKPYYRPQQTIDRAAIERRYRNLGYQRAVIEVRETPTEDAAASPSPTWCARVRRRESITCWSAAPSASHPTWCAGKWRCSPGSRWATTPCSRASSG